MTILRALVVVVGAVMLVGVATAAAYPGVRSSSTCVAPQVKLLAKRGNVRVGRFASGGREVYIACRGRRAAGYVIATDLEPHGAERFRRVVATVHGHFAKLSWERLVSCGKIAVSATVDVVRGTAESGFSAGCGKD